MAARERKALRMKRSTSATARSWRPATDTVWCTSAMWPTLASPALRASTVVPSLKAVS